MSNALSIELTLSALLAKLRTAEPLLAAKLLARTSDRVEGSRTLALILLVVELQLSRGSAHLEGSSHDC